MQTYGLEPMTRYRRNGKQVLRGDEHVCDTVNEPMAAVIVHALNSYDEPPPMVDNGPDLFGLNVVFSALPEPTIVETEPPCSIRQYGDQYACVTHKRQWDTDDTPPDTCKLP